MSEHGYTECKHPVVAGIVCAAAVPLIFYMASRISGCEAYRREIKNQDNHPRVVEGKLEKSFSE